MNLTGGYYDAGDNVKYQFPMAFTITMLAWSTIQYKATLQKMGELNNALDAIKWGTDYFLKCNTGPTQLWVQVLYLAPHIQLINSSCTSWLLLQVY